MALAPLEQQPKPKCRAGRGDISKRKLVLTRSARGSAEGILFVYVNFLVFVLALAWANLSSVVAFIVKPIVTIGFPLETIVKPIVTIVFPLETIVKPIVTVRKTV